MSAGAVEEVARLASGRLTAALARRTGDLAAAEDAVAEALAAALRRWPVEGTPRAPVAWLAAVARRRLVEAWRREEVRERHAPVLDLLNEQAERAWPDDRLALLFVCAHPALDPEVRVGLMLQTVLGLTADRIGALVGVPGSTMGQRLWRARRKVRDAGIPFRVPESSELSERVGAVLEALYGLYTTSWGPEGRVDAQEVAWLAQVVVDLLPDEAEAWGLRALVRYVEARREARRVEGRFVPLEEQDQRRWDTAELARADADLARAASLGRLGPFQLEAAIQSAWVSGLRVGRVDWEALLVLHRGLLTFGEHRGHGLALAWLRARAEGPAAGWAELQRWGGVDDLPWRVTRAELRSQLGDLAGAAEDWSYAADMAPDEAVAAWLRGRAAAV